MRARLRHELIASPSLKLIKSKFPQNSSESAVYLSENSPCARKSERIRPRPSQCQLELLRQRNRKRAGATEVWGLSAILFLQRRLRGSITTVTSKTPHSGDSKDVSDEFCATRGDSENIKLASYSVYVFWIFANKHSSTRRKRSNAESSDLSLVQSRRVPIYINLYWMPNKMYISLVQKSLQYCSNYYWIPIRFHQ